MNMNDDFQIELGESVRRHIEHKKSPREDSKFCVFPYDQPDTDQPPVFISQSVMKAIEKHVTSENDKEVGGVLLGGFYRTEKGSFVEITDFIEATSAKGTDVSLTFTHEAWEQITAEQSRRGSDLQIVGWYHSHPALGVFMSKEDEFIHSNFFSEPWHVAIVVDPIYHNWGCFKWNDGRLERTGGMYVFAEKKAAKSVRDYVKNLNTARQTPPRAASASADRRSTNSAGGNATGMLWAVIALLVIMQIITGYFTLTRKAATTEQINYYSKAIELLSASDLSGGVQYLRQELVEHPDNLKAYREMQLLDSILSSSSISSRESDQFDRINLMLAMADKMAMCDVECKKESDFAGLGDKKENSLKLAADDPVKRALAIYEQALPTRLYRIRRATLIRDAASLNKAKQHKLKSDWYDDSLKWLQEERLRQIAYGIQSGDSKYELVSRKLNEKDESTVKRIRADLNKRK